jgi:TPR repeat protein
MATRPTFIDIRSQSHGPLGGSSPSLRPLTSPRLHIAGEVPPELSPLDAFAAQSRLLAKQLEKTTSNGKRLSRLPPLTIEDSFNLPRPGYFRSVSAENLAGDVSQQSQIPVPGLKTELEDSGVRPVSIYPRLSRIPPSRSGVDPSPRFTARDEEQYRGRRPSGPTTDFGVRREQSPGTIEPDMDKRGEESFPSYFPARPSIDSVRQRDQTSQQARDTSTTSRGYDSRALAPHRSPFAQMTPSVRSQSADGSDEDYTSSLGASFLSDSRKMSLGNGLSNSPISPLIHPIPRSPSVSSELSITGSRLSRPTFNFSRPLSRASEPPFEMPSRQASSDSQPFVLADDTVHTPVSMHSEEFPDNTNVSPGAPSYVYSRFSLPRGKMLQRNSRIFQETHPHVEFRWEQPTIPYSNVQTYSSKSIATPPSPPSRPSTSSLGQASSTSVPELSDLFPGWPSDDQSRLPHDNSIQKHQGSLTSSTNVTRPSTTPSVGSESTIKARSQHFLASSIDMSAEEHVAKGVECHEQGSLNESTYHLRIAARQNHPTGMLLYALACRHGWGMRPNQREGVQWLRKAADSAFSAVAASSNLLKGGRSVDVLEQRTRKAQFALSIYELGVSHMNGWGIEQDKVLALRCFEIAGGLCIYFLSWSILANVTDTAWGDGDALAEAGFCYAQGIGCKKDLKKSAKFYRMAENKGISMVGNSWYSEPL